MLKYRLFEKTTMPSKTEKSKTMNGGLPTTSGGSGKSSTVSLLHQQSDPLDGLDAVREELRSVSNEVEDTGRFEIPSDAPPRAKALLAPLTGLGPIGLAVVLTVLGLAAIAAIAFLLFRGVLKL